MGRPKPEQPDRTDLQLGIASVLLSFIINIIIIVINIAIMILVVIIIIAFNIVITNDTRVSVKELLAYQ